MCNQLLFLEGEEFLLKSETSFFYPYSNDDRTLNDRCFTPVLIWLTINYSRENIQYISCFSERAAGPAHPRHALLECQAISHAQHWCQIWTKGYMDWCQWRPDIPADR